MHVRLTGTCVVTILVHVGPDTRTRVAGLAWWRCRLQMAADCRWPHGAAASKMERDASAAAAAAVAAAATPVAAAPAHSTSGAAAAATAAASALAFAAAVEEIARESSAAQLLLLAQRFGQQEERARTPWMVLQVLALGRQWECMQTAPPTAAQMPAYAKGLQAHGQPPMLLNACPACPPACLPALALTLALDCLLFLLLVWAFYGREKSHKWRGLLAWDLFQLQQANDAAAFHQVKALSADSR